MSFNIAIYCNCCNLFIPEARSELNALLCLVVMYSFDKASCVSGNSLIVAFLIGYFGPGRTGNSGERLTESFDEGVIEVVVTVTLRALDLRSQNLGIILAMRGDL